MPALELKCPNVQNCVHTDTCLLSNGITNMCWLCDVHYKIKGLIKLFFSTLPKQFDQSIYPPTTYIYTVSSIFFSGSLSTAITIEVNRSYSKHAP